MKKSTFGRLFAALLCAMATGFPVQADGAATNTGQVQYDVVTLDSRSRAFKQGELIVKFKSSSNVAVRKSASGRFLSAGKSNVDAVLKEIGVSDISQLMPLTGSRKAPRRIKSFSGKDVEVADLSTLYCIRYDAKSAKSIYEAADALKKLDEVEYAEPNYLVYTLATESTAATSYSDPMYTGGQQWGLEAINLPALWRRPVLPDSKRPVIAILDTGVDITHPDLEANIWINEAEANGADGADDDGNGFADDIHGYDFVNQTAEMRDNNGHGTHCAGIAAAVGNNETGIAGANPDALIMPVTVMQSDGVGDVATIIKGIDYAVANGADVISMSFGGYAYSIAEEQALARAYASTVLVAAAGNDGRCIYQHECNHPTTNIKNVGSPIYPAAFTFVFGVEASDENGQLASFSNYDDDGASFFNPTYFSEEQMYNYELRAPGTNIYSTFPGGTYRSLTGTSMACPLAAGAISRLLQAKEYASKELLFGDMINSKHNGVIDILAAYNIEEYDRLPELTLVSYNMADSIGGDGDSRPDAGEVIELYPILRNQWGQAENIKLWIELGENEDPEILELLTGKVDFGKPLSSYAKDTSQNPIRFRINPDCVDGRHIKLSLHATCDNAQSELVYDFTITVENGVEIGGMIEHDTTLYPNVHYIVTNTLAVPEGVTLTIKPGTVLKFKPGTGMSVGGHIKAIGTPDSMIVFDAETTLNDKLSYFYFHSGDTLCYVKLSNLNIENLAYGNFENSIINYCTLEFYSITAVAFRQCNICNNYQQYPSPWFGFNNGMADFQFVNYIENLFNNYDNPTFNDLFGLEKSNNIFSNYSTAVDTPVNIGVLGGSSSPVIYTTDKPGYFGSSREDIVRKGVWDIESGHGVSKFDLSNMLTRPNPDAHGIVWKVVVNGYDAQDEFEMLPPLGVGRHKFEVYYSKPVSKEFTPTIAMGVRPPYTQTMIAEDGSWNEAGDVYTAYLTITGRMAIDGLNRIYVSGGEDLEHFEIPIENRRFNVNVSAAGAMSTGFMAEPGLGKVSLTWEPQDENVDDILGYNLYRYQTDEEGLPTDTLRMNQQLIDDTEFTDFDVVPGQTYCYYYKIMRTDLSENSPSQVVAATPLTATKGDANGSMAVDVADVVTEVGYLTNQNPQPFIFDAADVNSDLTINILDIVGTINIILSPADAASIMAMAAGSVSYRIDNGTLYIDTPIELGGVQCTLNATAGTEIVPVERFAGFESVGQWTGDDSYTYLAYSMSGNTIPAGEHALLKISDAQLSEIILSDPRGNNVVAIDSSMGGIGAMEQMQISEPYPNPFKEHVSIPYAIGQEGNHQVRFIITDIAGRTVSNYEANNDYGRYTYTWTPDQSLARGMYFATLYVDGKQMQTVKLVFVK